MVARRWLRIAVLAGLSSLAVVACGGDPLPAAASGASTTTTAGPTSTTVPVDTSRIIPLNGDIAEVVFALGLGDDVVATDLSATFPPEADALPEIGYQRALTAETILTFEPTVVIGDQLAGPPGVLGELRRVGVNVLILDFPHDLTGPAAKIRRVADALGVHDRGEALATEVQAAIDAAVDDAAARVSEAGGVPPRAVFLYLRGERVQQVAGVGSGVDALIEAAGAVNIGSELGIDDFEPLTEESLLVERPDVIVVTTTGLESVGGVDGLVAIPAVAGTPAGRDRRVVALDDQLVLGLGPRTPDALAALVDAFHPTT